MTTGNNDGQNSGSDGSDGKGGATGGEPKVAPDAEMIDKLVKERVENEIKGIKEKLDKAYGARDEALKKLTEKEEADKAAELKRLQEEGKHREAYELQLAEERRKREVLEQRTVELTRDNEVRGALSGLTFRNENAQEMAYREVVGQLVKNDQGTWVHRSGVSVKDFIKDFAERDTNSFLFKPKPNTGGGGKGPVAGDGESNHSKGRNIFEMPQEEVLKLMSEGKLQRRRR